MNISFYSRSSRDWKKEYAFTWGDLHNHELVKERSAEAILGTGYELPIKGRGLTKNRRAERLVVPNAVRKLLHAGLA